MSSDPVIISGIGPDTSGTGRLLTEIIAQQKANTANKTRVAYQYRHRLPIVATLKKRDYMTAVKEVLRRSWNIWFWANIYYYAYCTKRPLVLFHAQSLRTGSASKILSMWRGPLGLFVLDASVFCIRSYNHVLGDRQACVRCLGTDGSPALDRGCEPFPLPDPYFPTYIKDIQTLAQNGRLKLLTQSLSQTRLLAQQFPPEQIHTVGLWTNDWNALDVSPAPASPATGGYDVVFHGHFVDAKGADWTIELARQTPEIRYLMPAAKHIRAKDAPENIEFKPMSWDSGLQDVIAQSRMTLVPSLWSAPIEGALIKSLLTAPRTAVIDEPTAYQAELPESIIHRLNSDPEIAATELRNALQSPSASPDAISGWWQDFTQSNRDILQRIGAAMRPNSAL